VNGQNHIRRKQALRQAEGYLELEMSEHALRALARLEDPADFDAHGHYLKGLALRGTERYEEALVPLVRAAKLRPSDVRIWLALGWCHKRTGRVDLAVQDLERALEFDPTGALIHYNLACYLSLFGDKPRALSHLSRALRIDANYRRLVDDEPDFDPIRSDPEFQALTSMIA
jgi:Flp pilus assembly protein TadD